MYYYYTLLKFISTFLLYYVRCFKLIFPFCWQCSKLISHILAVLCTDCAQLETHFPLSSYYIAWKSSTTFIRYTVHCFYQQFLLLFPYIWFALKISSPPIPPTFSYSLTPLNFTPYYHSLQSQIIFLCTLRKEDAILEDKRSLEITLYVLKLWSAPSPKCVTCFRTTQYFVGMGGRVSLRFRDFLAEFFT